MRIQIHLRAETTESDLRDHIERRLRFGLGRYGGEVRDVRFRLEDVNGPRQGVDKRCTIRIVGRRVGVLFLEDMDSDAIRAVDRLSDRVDRTLARALERARAFDGAPEAPTRPVRGTARAEQRR
jgi:putative sigma-54 modulation protein